MSLPPLVAAMLEPAFYPHRPLRVRLVQTHISYVFLAGWLVYKLRKPVRLPFLDFSTVARRRRDCEAEVRLNRRFAPGVYLAVIPIGRHRRRFAVGVRPAVEYAVCMRRLPADRQLAALVTRGRATTSLAVRLGRHLAALHARAATGPGVARHASTRALLARWRENLDTLAPFVGIVLSRGAADRLRDAGETFVARHRGLLRARQRHGRIRDGHGDLHAEHVYVLGRGRRHEPRGLVLVDCLEFSKSLRCGDVASDLGFLVMDLERRGASRFAKALVGAYRAASGDPELERLLPFYRCYRATVRAKVSALLSTEPEVEPAARARAVERAREYVALALRAAWELGPPILLVCAGLSGSGKSTLAAAIAAETGFVHLASDVVRKELAGLPPHVSGAGRPGFYGPVMTARTYATLLARARELLRAGRSVIVDATFLDPDARETARRAAADMGAVALVLDCRAPDAVVRERLRRRRPASAHASDATVAIYLEQQRRHAADLEVPGLERLEVNTAPPVADVAEDVLARVWSWWRRRW